MRARRAGVLADPRAAVAAAGLAALAGLLLAASGRVLLHQCVAAVGLSPLGVRLSVLQDAADCPDGTYAFGPAAGGAVLLLSVTMPLLVAHLVLTAGGAGLGVVLARAARGVAGLLHRWAVRVGAPVGVVVARHAARPVERDLVRLRSRLLVVGLPVRGPPVAA